MKEPYEPGQARRLLSINLAGGAQRETVHFREELAKDGLTMLEAMQILKEGRIYEPAELVNATWRYRVQHPSGCVVIAFGPRFLTLVTIWRKR